MPKLLLKFDQAVIKEIPVEKDVLTVGRKPENDIIIDNPTVSGQHCKIFIQGGTYFVEDLNSTNGTYVNDKKIMTAGLHHNDVIGVVKYALVFIDPPPVAAAEPEATVLIAPEHAREAVPPATQEQVAKKTATAAMPQTQQMTGYVTVTKGAVDDNVEVELKGLSTYIGKSDRMNIKIKGFFAPDVAANIAKRAEGYVLVAIKEGYPVVNGEAVTGQRALQDGDEITCGSTTMTFSIRPKT